jgi:hypothetical protein
LKDKFGGFYQKIKFYTGVRDKYSLYIFLICFLLASAIWLLIALSKTYTTVVDFPVEYVNIPEDKVIINKLPKTVSLELSSHGFGLLSYKLFTNEKTLKINISKYQSEEVGEFNRSVIESKNLFDDITDQLGNHITVHRFIPDVISIDFNKKTTKLVPVVLDSDISFKAQYKLDGKIELFPKAVTITGPKMILDTLSFIRTKKIKLKDLKGEVSKSIGFNIDSDIKDIEYSSNVIVKIPVDKFTEGSIMVPLGVLNEPRGYRVKTFPDSVLVKYDVGLNNFNRIGPNMFKAAVEMPDTTEIADYDKLQVKLLLTPETVQNSRVSPSKVEFIIRK